MRPELIHLVRLRCHRTVLGINCCRGCCCSEQIRLISTRFEAKPFSPGSVRWTLTGCPMLSQTESDTAQTGRVQTITRLSKSVRLLSIWGPLICRIMSDKDYFRRWVRESVTVTWHYPLTSIKMRNSQLIREKLRIVFSASAFICQLWTPLFVTSRAFISPLPVWTNRRIACKYIETKSFIKAIIS